MRRTPEIITAAVVIGGLLFWAAFSWFVRPAVVGVVNTHDKIVQKVDERTNYKTQKEVENYCRAMIASYAADIDTYVQYRDSQAKEERGWASQAKMRANRTASTYNNYILTNKAALGVNVPEDICMELARVE
jgi:hypothetical protein